LNEGRQVLAALAQGGSAWTQNAARDALAGSEADVRAFFASGREKAAEQDDRTLVMDMLESSDKPALRVAAHTALKGTPRMSWTSWPTPAMTAGSRTTESRSPASSPAVVRQPQPRPGPR
jgi:hypothetical protein